jgi:hypothetical protein
MPATGLARGRILNPLEIVVEDLEILHRDLAQFTGIERVRQFDNDVSCFIAAIKKAQIMRDLGRG